MSQYLEEHNYLHSFDEINHKDIKVELNVISLFNPLKERQPEKIFN